MPSQSRTEERRRWRKAHPDLLRAQKQRRKNRLKAAGKLKRYKSKYNSSKQLEYNRRYLAAHPEVQRERQVRRKRARCGWDNREVTLMIYRLARTYRSAGIPCHVDHIIPLCGKTVSGLHVYTNLTLLPPWDNIKKGNVYAD